MKPKKLQQYPHLDGPSEKRQGESCPYSLVGDPQVLVFVGNIPMQKIGPVKPIITDQPIVLPKSLRRVDWYSTSEMSCKKAHVDLQDKR